MSSIAMMRGGLASLLRPLRQLFAARKAGAQKAEADEPVVLVDCEMAAAPVSMTDPDTPPLAPPVLAPRRGLSRRLIAALMGGALLSKILGFARELMMAQVLGASLVADGFRGAMAVILLPIGFLQNESVPAILIPMQRDAQRAGRAAQSLGALTTALTLISIALMLLVEAAGTWWVDAIVGGFSAEGRSLTLHFVQIMALGMPASVILNCLAAGEIALGRSRLTNLRALMLNLCIMLGLLALAATGYVTMLAWAFTLSFNGLALWGMWSLWREGHLSFGGMTLRAVFDSACDFGRRLRPLLALPFAEQLNIWVERLLASRLRTGAVASLDYARTLTESALLLIAQPVGLGVLSSHAAQNERDRIEAIAAPVLALALPASAFAAVFATDIVRLIFFRGAFTETGVMLTSQTLQGIAFGLWASTLGWILIRVLNATGRNARAAMILVIAYAINVAVNLATSQLQHTTGYGSLLLGLGETARSFVLLGGTILALDCRRRLFTLVLIGLIPAAAMLLVGMEIHHALTGTLPRLFAGGAACAVFIVIAAAMLMPAQRNALLHRLRGRASTPAPAPDADHQQ